MAKMPFPEGVFWLKVAFLPFSDQNIRTWPTMPLKGHIIATFRRVLSDCSLPGVRLKNLMNRTPGGVSEKTFFSSPGPEATSFLMYHEHSYSVLQ
jgi:hypothetical protein